MRTTRRDPILMYHDVRSPTRPPDSIYSVDSVHFARHLTLLERAERRPCVARELGAAGDSKVLITFDDGRKGVIDHALPLLVEAGAPATLFVTASAVGSDGWCSANDLRRWVEVGNEIGTHGWTHESLTAMPHEQARVDIRRSKCALEDIVGSAVDSMSFPNGRLSSALVRTAREVGLKTVFGSWPGYGLTRAGAYGRFAILDRTTDGAFVQVLRGRGAGAYAPQRALFVVSRIIGESAYNRLHERLRSALAA